MIAGAQSITMANPEFFMIEVKSAGFKINRDVQLLLKITLHPHIMIAYKEMNGNA
jgi:hypothetical protein